MARGRPPHSRLGQGPDPAEDPGDFGRRVGDLPVGEAQDPEAGRDVLLIPPHHPRLLGGRPVIPAGRRSRRSGCGRGTRSRPRSRAPDVSSGGGEAAGEASGRKRISRSESESRNVCRSSIVRSASRRACRRSRRARAAASPGRRGRACPPRSPPAPAAWASVRSRGRSASAPDASPGSRIAPRRSAR